MEFRNFFLAALSGADADALVPRLKEVSLARGEVVYEVGDLPELIYLPGGACVSVVSVMGDGKAVEVATIGRESALALLDAALGAPVRSRMFAQIGGSAMTLPAAAFRARLVESPTLLNLTLRHARASAIQAELGVACNMSHSTGGRLARWLLMTQDRTGSDSYPLTQDYMAVMTGVQRSTVSVAAAALKHAGIIDYSRGQLAILDRLALIARACDCYGIVEAQFEELQGAGAG